MNQLTNPRRIAPRAARKLKLGIGIAALTGVLIVATGATAQDNTPTPRPPNVSPTPSFTPTINATATAAAVGATYDENGVVARLEGLYPEGVEFDNLNGRFLVSSTSQGTVFIVGPDGLLTPLVTDPRIPSSLGLEADEANNRLFVVAHNYETKANLGIYDLTTGLNVVWVDFVPLTPNAGARFPNDAAVDSDGIAYVTDSIVGVIYRVTTGGSPSIWLESQRFTTDFALNGIAYRQSDAGDYLIAVLVPGLIKIPLANPAAFTDVTLDQPLGREDGIVFLEDGSLAVVNNTDGIVYRVESTDDFVTASVTGEFKTGGVFPTTVAARGNNAYVLYSQLNQDRTNLDSFPVQLAAFE